MVGRRWLGTTLLVALFPIVIVVSYSSNSAAVGRRSDVIIHVGNLNWGMSPHELCQQFLRILHVDEDDRTTTNTTITNVSIQIKQLPSPPRKRDENKLHGGSATLTFPSTQQAKIGMERLLWKQQQQEEASSFLDEEQPWRVKWAFEMPSPPPSSKEVTTKKELSAEVLALRKVRAASYARRRQKVAQRTDQVIRSVVDDNDEDLSQPLPILEAPLLDWSSCPASMDPVRGGGLKKGTSRAERKHAAVEAFFHVVEHAFLGEDTPSSTSTNREEQVIADLGCGGGNLSLGLAWWLQQQQPKTKNRRRRRRVIAVDINPRSLDILKTRAAAAAAAAAAVAHEVSVVETWEEDLLRLIRSTSKEDASSWLLPTNCAAVVSLHACGSASDMAMAVAVSHSLPFAISPCCIGKIIPTTKQHLDVGTKLRSGRVLPPLSSMTTITTTTNTATSFVYPRSQWLRTALVSKKRGDNNNSNNNHDDDDYRLLAASADYGVVYNNPRPDDENNPTTTTKDERIRRQRCQKAKRIIETDRLLWAQEQGGYDVRMVELPRIGDEYPKRELLLGAKRGTLAAQRIFQLPTTTTTTTTTTKTKTTTHG